MIDHLCNKGGARVGRRMGLLFAGCVMMCGLWIAPSHSLGQIPTAAKSADQGAISQYQPAIKKYVADQVTAILGKDAAAQENARDALISQVGGRDTNTSVPFQYELSSEINTQVIAALSTADLRSKINLGVLVAGVAEAVNNDRLDGATRALLKDSNLSVRIWGLKASQSVLPALLRNPMTANKPAILADIANAAKMTPAHMIGAGAAYRAAYVSLSLGVGSQPGKRPDPAAVSQTIPVVLELVQQRVQAMRDKGIVDDVTVDAKTATFFLTHANVWDLLTPPQQVQTVQAMSDMIWLVAQRASKGAKGGSDVVWPYIKEAANQFWVIGDRAGSQELKDAVARAQRVSESVTGDEILQVTQGIYPALQTMSQFTTLTAPPTIPATDGNEQSAGGN